MIKSKTIILCGQRWKIEVVKEIPNNLAGCTYHETNRIEIRESHFRGDTLVHELFEAASWVLCRTWQAGNGNATPLYLYVMNHEQMDIVMREVWSGLTQIYELRVRK